jgi:hypothetical protein
MHAFSYLSPLLPGSFQTRQGGDGDAQGWTPAAAVAALVASRMSIPWAAILGTAAAIFSAIAAGLY